MSYANKLSSFELSFLLRATTAHALKGNDPLSGSRRRLHGAPEAIYADSVGRGVRACPHVTPRSTRTAGSLRLWNHALARMMIVRWANDLIAPFAVSQCLCVPDPSDGVGVKGELPAELAMLLFV